MDKTDRLRDYGLAFLLYEQGLGICGYELIRELFIFIKLILNSYLSKYPNASLPQIRSQSVCSNRFNCYACVRHQIEANEALVMPL